MALRFHWFLPTNGDGRDIDRIEEYASLGISEFILSGYPHLEEAYWFGEGVLPELERRGRWAHPAPATLAPQTMTPFAQTHTVSASTVSASTVSASTASASTRPADPASKVAP
jgi:hypothetical protein